jgi:hypothetical protein
MAINMFKGNEKERWLLGQALVDFMWDAWEKGTRASYLTSQDRYIERCDRQISFLYKERHYDVGQRTTIDSHQCVDLGLDHISGEVSLSCDGKEVLKVGVEMHLRQDFFKWQFRDLLLFKDGDWAPEIADLFFKPTHVRLSVLAPTADESVKIKQDAFSEPSNWH